MPSYSRPGKSAEGIGNVLEPVTKHLHSLIGRCRGDELHHRLSQSLGVLGEFLWNNLEG